jgi:hypothetical protein
MEWVALPFHKVLDSGTTLSFVKNGFHFVLGLAVDDERERVRVYLSGGVEVARVDVREELAHMEDIVDLHVWWQLKGTCCRRRSLDDLEWADVSRFELRRWVDVLEMDVMSRETNHVTNGVGNMSSCLVGVVPLTVLGLSNGCLSLHKGVMDCRESGCSRWVRGVHDE